VNERLLLGETALRPADVVAVAGGRRVDLSESARARMAETRVALERMLARGDRIYGVTTGVGAIKTVGVAAETQAAFNRLMLHAHAVGHGAPAPAQWTRATMLVRAAGLAIGASGVRPEVAVAFCDALNAGFVPTMHVIGSVGQADLAQMGEIGRALIGEGPDGAQLAAHGLRPLELEPREAHAIVNSNAFSTGVACLALHEARSAVDELDASAALSFEAIRGNVDQLHPQISELRPYPGHLDSAARLRELLAGGALADGRTPARQLQDALVFKGLAQTHGAARDSLAHLEQQLTVELRSSGDSPMVVLAEDRAISTGNHDAATLAIALDYARLGLAQAATIACERIQKLLAPAFTDLPSGLRADADSPEDGLAIVGHGAASVAAEIRLLAAPVTLEQPTSSIAESIEDRVTLAPVGARRLHEQAELSHRLAAIELMCAAQAIDLLGRSGELGAGTARAYATTRDHVPFTAAGEAPVVDLDPLVAGLRASAKG
jgi:histidine ammonia-lyase